MKMRNLLGSAAPLLVCAAALLAGPSPAPAQPPNDDFDSATVVVEPLPFSDAESTVLATTAPDDPYVFGQGPTVWYAYTPSADGWIEANTFGSNYDTTLGAFTGTRGALTQIAANDDSGSLQSRVVIPVTAGTTYHFMVGAFASGPGGNLVFNVLESSPPPDVDLLVNPIVSVDPKSGLATVRLGMSSTGPVFLYGFDVLLKQRTGRGNVIGSAFMPVFDIVSSFSGSVLLADAFGGKGFTGGKANLSVVMYYEDPILGFQAQVTEIEAQLKGKK